MAEGFSAYVQGSAGSSPFGSRQLFNITAYSLRVTASCCRGPRSPGDTVLLSTSQDGFSSPGPAQASAWKPGPALREGRRQSRASVGSPFPAGSMPPGS